MIRCIHMVRISLRLSLAVLLSVLAWTGPLAGRAQTAAQLASPTVINVGSAVQMSSVRRLGINLGRQTYYDSGMMLKNLVSRNPGFEGEIWQSILHCKWVTATTCTDDNLSSIWPANFFAGAQMEVLTGNALGSTAQVTSSTVASYTASVGITVRFSGYVPMSPGDFVAVRMSVPGNAGAGWWTTASSGAAITTEFNDLSPSTPGTQALRVDATASNASATVSSYFDSTPGVSFVQMNGGFHLSFRAKGVGGNNQMIVQVSRNSYYLLQTIQLSNSWQDYDIPFTAADTGVPATAALTFKIRGAAVLLDDVLLDRTDSDPANTTPFRDEVVSTLKNLKPGILRDMDSGINWGSSLDNMLAPPFARMRAGYNNRSTEMDDIPVGLHDFLVLCKAVGAEPWYTLQTGMSTQEMTNLMEYLGGSASTPYGAQRAALGQSTPWTSVFKTIHFEFGNEVWNTANPGASMNDAAAYGGRASTLFTTAHNSPYYTAKGFDLILDGWSAVPAWTSNVLAASDHYDSIGVAPYIFDNLNDTSSLEAIYGPMFAQPEQWDSQQGGLVQLNAQAAASAAQPANLAVYETNLGTVVGASLQSTIDAVVPSVGGGIAQAAHMLLMLRDLGINNQNMFSLGGYRTNFQNGFGFATKTPLWGTVVDMGNTNLVRPTYLAEQLANNAILPTLLTVSQSGANPTWNQPLSINGGVFLNGAHYIQSFSFTDGKINNLVLFNLSRTKSLPVTFAGPNAPTGNVTIQTLTSDNITDGNESSAQVATSSTSATLTDGQPYVLPPFSMTVISHGAPSVSISSVSVTCTPNAVNVVATVNCTSSVQGTGTYSSAVQWRTSYGVISSSGVYVTPSTAPSSRQVIITAISKQDPTVSGTATITVLPSAVQSVAASCLASSLATPAYTNCSASVAGVGNYNAAVRWTASAGVITSTGVYTTPALAPSSGYVTITASSLQDSSQYASTTIALSSITGVKPTCAVSLLTASSSAVCTAMPSGIGSYNTGVYWSADFGSINSIGTYTAPDTVPDSGRATITAVSMQDGTKVGTFSIAITPKAGAIRAIYVTCLPANILPGTFSLCTARISGVGASNPAVTWSTTAGTISPAGLLIAPNQITSMTVTATSVQTPTVSGTALVSTLGAPTLSPVTITNLTPTSVTLSWTTNVMSSNGVDYGVTTRLGGITPYAPLSTSPSFTLTGLTPGQVYYLHVRSTNYGALTVVPLTITTPSN